MNKLEFLKNIKFTRPTTKQIIFWGVAVLVAGGLFAFARGMTRCWQLTQLPGRPPDTCTSSAQSPSGDYTPQPGETSVAVPPTPVVEAPAAALPPAWDGASRINILFIGLDARDIETQDGPPRSDTMILVTIDPVSK